MGVGIGRFYGDDVNVSYLDAFRSSYVRETFSSDYFYTRGYKYDYSEAREAKQTLVDTNYSAWGKDYSIDALFDEDETNFIHSDRTDITADNPFTLTVMLDKPVKANRFTVYGEPSRLYLPTDFELYGGPDPEHLELIAKAENAEISGSDVHVDFGERELQCYKLYVTDTSAPGTKYIAYRRAGFSMHSPTATCCPPTKKCSPIRETGPFPTGFPPSGISIKAKTLPSNLRLKEIDWAYSLTFLPITRALKCS